MMEVRIEGNSSNRTKPFFPFSTYSAVNVLSCGFYNKNDRKFRMGILAHTHK